MILGRPEEDELLALKEDGNMRATRWMAHMTPEEEDNDVLRRHSLFRDGVIKDYFVEPCSNLSKPFYKRICSSVFLVVAACM